MGLFLLTPINYIISPALSTCLTFNYNNNNNIIIIISELFYFIPIKSENKELQNIEQL
jgi:hypothetical protein